MTRIADGAGRAERDEVTGAKSPGTRTDIAERVLAYFQRNSQAMDSVQGIARFWLHEDHAVVERCLGELHDRGLLARRNIAGTDFYSLPQSASPDTVPAAEAGAPALERGRILVIDDDAGVRKFLVAALTERGHEVKAAEGGEEGLAEFSRGRFDLVVTDVKMPGISGLEVVREVKRRDPAVEVIVVTAFATLETAIRALRNGSYDLITKPIEDLESLFRVVERALEKRRLSAENRLLVKNLTARNVELKENVARLAAVNEIGLATTGMHDLDELYASLARLVSQHLKARRVSVLVADGDADMMRLAGSVGIAEEVALACRVKIGEGIAGQVAASQKPLLVEDIGKTSLRGRNGAKYSTASFMITPLSVSYPIRYQRRRVGVINVSDKHSGDPFNEQDLEFLSTLASQVAVAIENARLVREMEDGYFAAMVSLIQASEDARPETRDHSMRVAELAVEVGRVLGLSGARLQSLARAAALHEIGRLAARGTRRRPEARPGVAPSWTSEAVMAAEKVLAPIASLRGAREIILRSADWYDATPLPFGSERPAGVLESRIFAACEEFVRLAPANGADPAARQAALETLRKLSGRKHDPEVVEALGRLVEGSRS
jgi:response regulator RpfG family c-di-GMP phosphodiesterase